MKEHKIDDQYSIFYEYFGQDIYFVELHDFYNLTFYRGQTDREEFNLMKIKPKAFI